jgi:hypothetical protein
MKTSQFSFFQVKNNPHDGGAFCAFIRELGAVANTDIAKNKIL